MIDQYPSANGVLTSLIWRKTMSGGETSLSGYDNASQALSYTPGQEQVYLNGILLVRGDDYTATNGTSITGLAALAASDFVQINCYNNFSVASLPVSGLVGTIANNQLQNSAITINGSAISLGGSVTLSGDIESVTAGTGLTGGGNSGAVTLSLDTASVISPTIINAKGDILTASADNTPAILSLGNSGESIVADSSTTTGLRYTENYAAGKNRIINGDFTINQRSFTSITASGYTFDRWRCVAGGDGTTTITAQTFTLGAAPVAGYESTNFLQIASTGQTSSSVQSNAQQRIESVRTFAGQTVTISFWAKATSGTPKIAVDCVQNFGTGGSPSSSVETYVGQVTLSTSWARYSITVAVPSVSGKTLGTTVGTDFLQFTFWTSAGSAFNARTGSLGIQTATIGIWGVQAEAGSVATAFQTATGSIQGELAACQRYYYRQTSVSSYGWMAYGGCQNTTNGQAGLVLPVQMRVVPTALEYANVRIVDSSYAGSLTSLALNTGESTPNLADIYVTGSGITGGRPLYIGANNNTGAYLAVTAEL